ncbi:hypothetical protein V9Z49_10025 [Streptococcus suis]|uniref:hypothetical protein n=1 Tax=Streptococcus suis TaxID=1307 RepID=UPI00300FBAE2
MTDIIDLYLETGDFHEAVKKSGLPTHVAHLQRESGLELEQPNTLLVPMQFIEEKKELHISPSGPWFNGFKVEAEELQSLLKDYARLRKDGLF